jgi:trk system potassium uptake protein TrkH
MSTKLLQWFKNNGAILLILSGFQMIPILYSIVTGEAMKIINGHLWSFMFTILIGAAFVFIGRKTQMNARKPIGMVTAASALVLIVLSGAMTYVLTVGTSPIDAFFESASGFTTTGMSVFTDIGEMPRSLLLWRSMTQWIGGLFALVFFIMVTFRNEDQLWRGYSTVLNNVKLPRHISNIYKGIVIFAGLFSVFTILQTIILTLSGVPFFDAVTHSMNTISTGGFSNFDEGGLGFLRGDNLLVDYTTVVFMFLGGMSYFFHARYVLGDVQGALKSTTFYNYIKLILMVFVAFMVMTYLGGNLSRDSFFNTLFMSVSAVSTTGYGLKAFDLSNFTSGMVIVLIPIMIIGGSMGSPAGGIKVNRITLVIRMLRSEFNKLIAPKQAVIPVQYDMKIVDRDLLVRISVLITAWLGTLFIGTLILSLVTQLELSDLIVVATSAVGNSGVLPITFEALSEIGVFGKLTLSAMMIAGRVEIIPILLLFNYKIFSKRGGAI